MPKNVSFDKDYGFDKLMTTFKLNGKESYVNVGFLQSAGTHKGSTLSVAEIAAVHEFGSSDGRIPQRSFMRSAVAINQTQIEELTNKLAEKVVDQQMPRDKALGVLGEFIKGKIVARINAGVPPPNAPETVERKGSSRTLIDTGQMKQSISWEVKKGGT